MERQTLAIAIILFASITTFLAPDGADRNRSQRVDLLRVGSSSERTMHPLSGSASLSATAIKIDDSTVEVEVAPGDLDLPVPKLIAWVSAAAEAVTCYYGHFPVHEARVLIVPVEDREGVLNGTSWGTRPAFTRIYVGQLTDDDELKNNWVMTHEMVHYAFPSVAAEHHWLEEGIATYVEPIARLEAGQIQPQKYGATSSGAFHSDCRSLATKASIIPPPGAALTGAERCSACSPSPNPARNEQSLWPA
jgi:hypothetical protein